jgi:AcrR family transcriptional regulator
MSTIVDMGSRLDLSTDVDILLRMTTSGRPRRSQDTKARILAAARRRFASDGYELATVRGIAAEAAVDPALVMRYFGSKDGLFAAAAEFDLRLPDLSAIPRAALGAALVRHFLARWEGDPADDALRLLLRTAVTNPAAAQRMREIFAGQLRPALEAVTPAGEAERRAGLVASQILGLALCRHILEIPATARLGAEEVVAWVGPTIQRYLTGAASA